MATTEEQQQQQQPETNTSPSPTNWKEKVENKYLELKEHAETYPYVWASYIVVYGGFAMWTGYRWRKLRKTETRVRGLQERLRKLVEAEEAAASKSSAAASSSSSAAAPQIQKSVTNKSQSS